MKNATAPAMDAEFDLNIDHLGPIETLSRGLDNAANTARSATAAAAIGAGVAGRKLVKPLAFAAAIATPVIAPLAFPQEASAQQVDMERVSASLSDFLSRWIRTSLNESLVEARRQAQRSEEFHNLPAWQQARWLENLEDQIIARDFSRAVMEYFLRWNVKTLIDVETIRDETGRLMRIGVDIISATAYFPQPEPQMQTR